MKHKAHLLPSGLLPILISAGMVSQTHSQTTPPPAMIRPEVKLLHGQHTLVTAYERDNKSEIGLTVSIAAGRSAEPLPISDVKVRAFDQNGAEMSVALANPEIKFFARVWGQVDANYVVAIKKGQRVASVEMTRQGETQKFVINEVSKGIKELPSNFKAHF